MHNISPKPQQFSSVQFSHSVVSDSLWPHVLQHARPPCPSPTLGVHSDSSIESVMPSSHLILCRPLLFLPPIPPSIRVFSNESTLCMRWPKYWSFSFSISPSKEIPGLISFRMDWLDLLAVQGTLKSLLLHHSSKASILRRSAFFTVQLSHPYMTTGKTIALIRRTFKRSFKLLIAIGCVMDIPWGFCGTSGAKNPTEASGVRVGLSSRNGRLGKSTQTLFGSKEQVPRLWRTLTGHTVGGKPIGPLNLLNQGYGWGEDSSLCTSPGPSYCWHRQPHYC